MPEVQECVEIVCDPKIVGNHANVMVDYGHRSWLVNVKARL